MRRTFIALTLLISLSGAVMIPSYAHAEEDDGLQELQKDMEKRQKAMESLNQMNPLSETYDPTKASPNGAGANLTGPMADLQKLLNQPGVRGYLSLFSNPAFKSGIEEVLKSPNRMNLLYAELGLVLFMLVFRAWRFSKSIKWYARLWTNFWTLGMGWALSAIVLPSIVIGPGYITLVKGTFENLLKMIQM